MRYFPVFLDTRDTQVLVVGAGAMAEAKLRLLRKCKAQLRVFCTGPVSSAIKAWAQAGDIELLQRPIERADLSDAKRPVRLLYVASGEAAVDSRAHALASEMGILVNVVDVPEQCAFITPAMIDRDPVCVAIGTEGAAPVLARQLKFQFESMLGEEIGALARIAERYRARIKARGTFAQRRRFWHRFFASDGPAAWRRGRQRAVEAELERRINNHFDDANHGGRVSLVGTGPGDPSLLTLRARQLIAAADVIVHDRLVPAPILELARREAVFLDVGKQVGDGGQSQPSINALLIDQARRNQHVVRLKSGDPVLFGRLDEELDALQNAAIEYEVVPGITAASAAAARLGVSLTRRGRNGQITFLTGHDVDGFREQDWAALCAPGAVTAIYMGHRALRFIQLRLQTHGIDPDTPVSVLENISRPGERIVQTQVSTMHFDVTVAGLSGPVLILLGVRSRQDISASLELMDQNTELQA